MVARALLCSYKDILLPSNYKGILNGSLHVAMQFLGRCYAVTKAFSVVEANDLNYNNLAFN